MLTPSERRGALLLLALLALGTCWDLVSAAHPRRRTLALDPPRAGAASAPDSAPTAAPVPPPAPAAPRALGKPAPARAIDLNRAGAAELGALPGIGPVLARRIVDYRDSHGGFHAVEELLAVRGIGPHLFERIRPYVKT